MEKGEKQHSGIAIVWFCLDRVTIPSQAEGLCPSKYQSLFLITFTTFLSLFDFCKLYTWTFHPLRKLRGRHNGTNGGMMCTQTFPKLMIYLDSPYKYSIHHHLQYCSPCLYSECDVFCVHVCSTASEYFYFDIHSGISDGKLIVMLHQKFGELKCCMQEYWQLLRLVFLLFP